MKKKVPKPHAGLCVIGAMGASDRHPDMYKHIDQFEALLKEYAKKYRLDIQANITVWELK